LQVGAALFNYLELRGGEKKTVLDTEGVLYFSTSFVAKKKLQLL